MMWWNYLNPCHAEVSLGWDQPSSPGIFTSLGELTHDALEITKPKIKACYKIHLWPYYSLYHYQSSVQNILMSYQYYYSSCSICLWNLTYLFTLIYSLIFFCIRRALFPLYSIGCSINDNYPLWSIFIPPLAVLCSVTDDPRCLEHFWGNFMNKKCKLQYLTDCVLGDVTIIVIIDMHFSNIM